MLTASQLVAAAEPRSTEDLQNAFRDLLRQGLTQSHALDVLHEFAAAGLKVVSAETAVSNAIQLYGDDECEIDDNALFSQCDEGVWVSGWLWVPSLGIEETEQ